MKKLLFAALCSAVVLCSCERVNEGKKLTPDESKDKMEKTLAAFMDACPASDFDDLSDFASFLGENYFKSEVNYDFSALDSWYEESCNSSVKEEGSIVYVTFVLSQYTGKFTFTSNGIKYEEADVLSFCVTDDKDAEWVFTLEPSGKVKEFVNSDIDGTELTVKIPEKVIVTLTRNGKQMMKETITYDISLSSDINVSKDKATVSHEFAIKDYIINIKTGVDGKTGEFQANASLTKKGQLLLKGSFMGEVEMTGDVINNATISNATNVKMNMDIMSAMQITGTTKNVKEVYNANDCSPYDKEGIIAAVKTINSQLDLKFFYDNTKTEQGHFEVEEYEYDSEGKACWGLVPVIVFHDNSRYLLPDYFNENDFANLVENFNAFVAMYQELFERIANSSHSEVL